MAKEEKKRKKKIRHTQEEENQKDVSENKDKRMEKIKDFQAKSDKEVKGKRKKESIHKNENRLKEENFIGIGDIGDVTEISDEEFFNALASDTSFNTDDSDEGDEKDSKPHKKQMLLHWMKKPLDINLFNGCPLCMLPCLDPRLEDTLRKMGFDSLFPVQLAVWHMTVGPGGFERDICVNSPTGSGKTLAYALPIVQMLSTRNIRCLRALIVVPTRDLAMQVKQVFDIVAPAVGLCVGLAVGQSSIEKEISSLIKRSKFEMGMSFDPEDSHVELESLVDILVATPGRLVDHINTTKGFSLEHLQYLVVDEVDRLVGESYQFWLPAVLQVSRSAQKRVFKQASSHNSLRTIRRCGVERGFQDNMYPRLVKMIFSATLTKDPNKLDQLDLHHSLYMTAGDRRYNLPKKLESYGLICTTEKKLLNLAALLEDLDSEKSIVFTSSINLTHRLCTSLNLLGCLPCKINEYSRLQNQSARSKILKDFREGRIDVLVSSDGMTRGMDVEGIKNVINYDLPMYVKKYIHRAGRTARAGQAGRCFTLLRKNETKSFKNMLEKVGIDSFSPYAFPAASLQRLEPLCITAMEKLIELEESKSSKQVEASSKFNKAK
ncbi:DEAD-box ATP-dependent RNA helicase 1 [Zostera marina]|uniref:ATP-dependent RNA helicase n=1 Tax=Zostera marina TaxID=29655 RepID=A0A0K9PD62_ZOSMR|nr:DEAD-box ATP-dependent RNA helicase 1 [Zostera marina]